MLNQTVEDLVGILLNRSINLEIRDDAAMDLGEFDEDEAFTALVEVATDPSEEDYILYSCGESLADIWRRRGEYNVEIFNALRPAAKQEVEYVLSALKAV